MDNTTSRPHPTLAHLYAALTGTAGLVVLAWLFDQTHAIDLATLLAFALTAVLVCYFRVPVGPTGAQIGLDGAVLLGATLAGGPALGGWASFAAGLVSSIVIIDQQTHSSWTDRAAQALLNGGRNVLAAVLAWWAYQGMNGSSAQVASDSTETLAVILLCLVYALVRYLWPWPFLSLQTHAGASSNLLTLTGFLLELLPLPSAILTAATFVRLGWPFFLLQAFVFVGLGAVMRQMLIRIVTQQDEIEALSNQVEICEAIAQTPEEIPALSLLAYRLCKQITPVSKFELGLYDPLYTQITIQVSVSKETRLPSMRMPVTPMWEWLRQQPHAQRIQGSEMLSQLPFVLPPIEENLATQSVLFVPLLADGASDIIPAEPVGGMILQAHAANAFTEKHLAYVTAVANHISRALVRNRERAKKVPTPPAPLSSP